MKLLMMSAFSMVFAAGTAFAGMNWDANSDDMIDSDEYMAAMEEDTSFSALDTDGDGMLSSEEYYMGMMKMYDADADGMWNQTETGAFRDSTLRLGSEVSQ